MAGLKIHSFTLGMSLIALLLVMGLCIDLLPVWHAYRINQAVERTMQASKREAVPEGVSPEVRLAHAWRLNEMLETELAIADYRLLAGAAGVPRDIRIAAHYNLGNTYLREALDQAQKINVDSARAQGQLAKSQLREVLRLQPDHWDARYNLEVAHRLVPDLPLGEGGEPEGVMPEDVWSDIPGSPYGLP